jgi:short-subunit dehydrogenase
MQMQSVELEKRYEIHVTMIGADLESSSAAEKLYIKIKKAELF